LDRIGGRKYKKNTQKCIENTKKKYEENTQKKIHKIPQKFQKKLCVAFPLL